MATDWQNLHLTERADGVVIPVRVTPRGGRSAIEGISDGVLQVRLAAPPVEGAANTALLALLAAALHVPKSTLSLASGARSRQKLVQIRGLNGDEVRQRFNQSGG